MRDDGQTDASDAGGAPDVAIERLRRPRPRREGPRPRTLDARELAAAADDGGGDELHPLELAALQDARPRTRGDCAGGERPCPFVGCRHHLYLEVDRDSGHVKLNFPDAEPWDLSDSCSLDVAERDGITLEETGELLNVTRERVRQLEKSALIRAGVVGRHLHDRDVAAAPVTHLPADRRRLRAPTEAARDRHARRAVVIALLREGVLSNGDIAAQHGISPSYVSQLRAAEGLPAMKRGRKRGDRPSLTADRDAKIVSAMAAGGDRREVAARFDVTADVVSQVCCRARARRRTAP